MRAVAVVRKKPSCARQRASTLRRTPLVCSSTIGVGKDNPADPLSLTELQRSRSVMFLIQSRSSFSVRLALSGCCSTGRMFLFA